MDELGPWWTMPNLKPTTFWWWRTDAARGEGKVCNAVMGTRTRLEPKGGRSAPLLEDSNGLK
jgi:hypothetical protein